MPYAAVFADWPKAISCPAMVSASAAGAHVDADGAAVVDDIVAETHCCPTSIHRHYSVRFAPFDPMIYFRTLSTTLGPAFRLSLLFSASPQSSRYAVIAPATHSPRRST